MIFGILGLVRKAGGAGKQENEKVGAVEWTRNGS